MTRSLSVLLPVHNVQSSLDGRVREILDVMAELTSRFELVIIDEGSTDGTWDVARALAQLYPQIRLLRDVVESLSSSLSLRAEVRDSSRVSERRGHVRKAQGDVVIAHDGRSPIDAQEIVRLWRSLAAAAAPAPKFLGIHGAPRAARASASANPRSQGFRLLRSPATEDTRRLVSASGMR